MTSLLHIIRETEIVRRPVDPGGVVVRTPHASFVLRDERRRHIEIARIDLARHDDGLWMWAVCHHFDATYGGYQVGPKWGKFARSKHAAIEAAIAELLERCERYADQPRARQAAAWARDLRLDAGGRA